jgi:hypothetical protein
MAIPHIVIGLVFAFFGAEQVQLIETQLQTRLPAGFDRIGRSGYANTRIGVSDRWDPDFTAHVQLRCGTGTPRDRYPANHPTNHH